MSNLLGKAVEWLDGQRVRHLSEPVAYWRGTAVVVLPAAVGRTEFEVDNGTGVLEKVESRDFLIRTSDLVLGGENVLPERGDQIRETKDGLTYVYEVMAPGREPCWRYSDPYRRALRVHTKLVDTLEA
jgi:hypothetical protein